MSFSSSDIQIFILTVNRPAYCEQAVQSVLAQKGNYDIWVLDNSDNDDTEIIIKKYPNVKYIRTKRGTLSANFTKMQELISKPYVLTLHDDDLIHPCYLELALKALNTYKDIYLIAPKQNSFFTPHPPKEYYTVKVLSSKHWLIENQPDFALCFWEEPSPSWSGSIINAKFYKNIDVNWYLKTYGKVFDWPLMIQVMPEGKAVIFQDKNCFFYRIHQGQNTNCKDTGITLEQLTNYLFFFKKYALLNKQLYKIYFRRSVSNSLSNWRFWTSKKETAQKTEKEFLEYLIKKDIITKAMLFYYKTNSKAVTKIFAVPFKLYCKRNYYKKMIKYFKA